MYRTLALGILLAFAVLMLEWALQPPNPVTVSYRMLTDGERGQRGEFTITNDGDKEVTDWRLSTRIPAEIEKISGATVAQHAGNRYTLVADPLNRSILPGKTATVTITAAPGGFPTPHSLAKVSYTPVSAEPVAEEIEEAVVEKADGSVKQNYAEALQKSLYFYEAQRSGKLPEHNRVPWRGDSALGDGGDVGVDLSGGYYDAGDHIKFAFPLSSALTVLAWGGVEYKKGFQQSRQWPQYLETIRWGTDWLMKAHASPTELYAQVGEGELDHASWAPAEQMTMPRRSYKITPELPGSDLAGEAAAAFAAASIVFREDDPSYSARLLGRAKQLYAFAVQYQGKYSDSVLAAQPYYNSTGYWDELAWAAAWLYRASGQASYLAQAENIYQKHLLGKRQPSTLNWDDKRPGAAVLLAQLTQKEDYRADAEDVLDFWTVGRDNRRIYYSPGGLAWLTKWGSLRYTANTALLAFIYTDTVNPTKTAYRDFAVRQANYILGDNPARRSYMVGYGSNAPKNPHHRGSHASPNGDINFPPENTHMLYGAVVGGPKQPDDSAYTDDRTDLHGNEVALDYNAGFTGVLAKMIQLYGGKPSPDFPPKEVPKAQPTPDYSGTISP